MDSYLVGQVQQNLAFFSANAPFVSYTLHSGLEVYSVSQRKIKVVSLNKSANSTRVLDVELDFDAAHVCANQSEQLMCFYDKTHCCAINIHPAGSTLTYTTVYKVDLAAYFKEGEEVVQVLFNNVSKFQSELVVLTSSRIVCYDVNESLTQPTQSYNLTSSAASAASANASFSFDVSASQISFLDPVSITFGSSATGGSPQQDLTLFILTSDFSVFRIFPFFPAKLGVDHKWQASLFEHASVLYKSLGDVQSQSRFVPTLKFSALLSQSSLALPVKEVLRPEFHKGKVVGPIPVEPFFDSMYSLEARQIVSLPGGVLSVVADKAVATLFYESSDTAVFESDSNTTDDKLALLDVVLFNSEILSSYIRPQTQDALVLKTSQYFVVVVDFSDWLVSLQQAVSSGDVSEFSRRWLTQKTLPTKVKSLGQIQARGSWLVWNDELVMSIGLMPGTKDTAIMMPLYQKLQDVTKTLSQLSIEAPSSSSKKYVSQLSGSYQSEVVNQLEATKRKLAQLRASAARLEGSELDPESVEDLAALQKVCSAVSVGVVSLLDDLAALSQRLSSQRAELKNQITTLEKMREGQKKISPRMSEQEKRVERVQKRQAELRSRVQEFKDKCGEVFVANSEAKDTELSSQEVAYAKFLNSVRRFVLDESKQYKATAQQVQAVSQMDQSELVASHQQLSRNASAVKLLGSMKQRLEDKQKYVKQLTSGIK